MGGGRGIRCASPRSPPRRPLPAWGGPGSAKREAEALQARGARVSASFLSSYAVRLTTLCAAPPPAPRLSSQLPGRPRRCPCHCLRAPSFQAAEAAAPLNFPRSRRR